MVYRTVCTPFIHLTMKTYIFQAKGGAGVGAIGGAGFASLVTSLKAAKVFRTRLKESVSDLLLLKIMSFISENSINVVCKHRFTVRTFYLPRLLANNSMLKQACCCVLQGKNSSHLQGSIACLP